MLSGKGKQLFDSFACTVLAGYQATVFQLQRL
jgi:hypothetical protein